MKIRLLLLSLLLPLLLSAQKKQPNPLNGGNFELGIRSTISLFNDAGAPGMGYGGQFRLKFLRRLNTEWFADYFTVNIGDIGTRQDAHIGWSVMMYPFNPDKLKGKFTPYIIAGHCFDYSRVSENSNATNYKENFSSAVQMGLGTSYNFTDNFDLTLICQYMNHLGGHLHSHTDSDAFGIKHLVIEKESKADFEGHLLFTLSLNVKIADLW